MNSVSLRSKWIPCIFVLWSVGLILTSCQSSKVEISDVPAETATEQKPTAPKPSQERPTMLRPSKAKETRIPPTAFDQQKRVTITAPGDTSEVGMIISVRGRVTAFNPGEHLVVLTKRRSDKRWQVKAIDPPIRSGGTWAVDDLQLGEPQDTGQEFQICAAITTQTHSSGQLLESVPADVHLIVSVKRSAEEPEAVTITSPKTGGAVDGVITVEGKVRKLSRNENLILLVRPIPDDPNQSWWVQSAPVIKQDGRWTSSPVYIGIDTDRGVPFRLHAVITTQKFALADQLPVPPKGQSHTIDVKRR
jgi:hypothetical protein